jgi:hypothetical protein
MLYPFSQETCLERVSPEKNVSRQDIRGWQFILKFDWFYQKLCFSRLILQAKKTELFYFEKLIKTTKL